MDIRTIHDDQLDLFNQGHLTSRIESWASSSFKHRMEYSYPLLDKRIVEFALGIPSSMYYQKGQGRFLYRHAIRGLLPDDMRWGNFKLEPNRVKQLLKNEREASRLWLNKIEQSKGSKLVSSYIDYQRLKEKIISSEEVPLSTYDEEVDRVNNILKSIFTLKLK